MSRRRVLRGATAFEHAALLLGVGWVGAAGLAALGGSLHGAVAGARHGVPSDAAHLPAAHGPALQAGVAHAARAGARWISELNAPGARELRVHARPRGALPLDAPATNLLLLRGVRHSPAEVRVLREAAHALHLDVAAGRAPEGSTRLVQLDRGPVEVGAVPLHRRFQASALSPSFEDTRVTWRVRSYADAQDAQLFALLDDALDLGFARGFTGLGGGRRVDWAGADRSFAFGPGGYVAPGVWEFRLHGQPDRFQVIEEGRVRRDVTADEAAVYLAAHGHEPGEPVLLRACHAGECAGPRSAAQDLADALDAPVIAASDAIAVSPNGRSTVGRNIESEGAGAASLGEWRLVQPSAWGTLPRGTHVVVGRGAADFELCLGSVLDLWKLPEGSASRIEVAGPAFQYNAHNAGALDAAHRALAPNGRLVLRVPEARTAYAGGIVARLRERGFVVRQLRQDGPLFLLATKH